MASLLPPPYGVAFEFDCVLFNAGGEILANPTIAAGDFVISKENGATANLTTLPSVTPAGSGIVRVQLSAEEMQSHKSTVKWHDVGGEWRDGALVIFTSGQTLDTIDALIDMLVARLTADRAGYLDKLNVSGVLAHSDDANTYKATGFSTLDAAGVRTAVGLASANLDTQLDDLPTKAELDAAIATGDDAVLAAIALLENLSSAGAQAAAAAALTAYGAATATNVTNATSPLATAAAVAALNNLSQAQAQAAATAALNAYGGPTKTEMDAAFTTADDAVLAAIAALNNTSATDFLTALQAMLVDGAITWMELQRVLLALIAGETTGGGTTNLAFLAQDGLTERIAATVDGSGNRTSVTLDGSA